MERSWRLRAWVLIGLFLGPFLAQAGLGMLWLWQRGWLATTAAALVWVAAGAGFALLARRWSDSPRLIIPPLDWDAPETFSPLDKGAWAIVAREAQRAEAMRQEALLGGDLYVDAGRTLLRKLAEHYHPKSTSPLDQVPLVDLLTALELASEDLAGLCRQIPGGDLITLSHWRKAVQAAGYANKANDIYSYLLPLINPISGLARLGARELIVKPAWRSTQENALRWFFEAYLNRLGMHLIELLSGRLASGSIQYRRLTRGAGWAQEAGEQPPKLVIATIAHSGAPHPSLIANLQAAVTSEGREAASLGLTAPVLARLAAARWIESGACLPEQSPSTRRARAARQQALNWAVGADLIVLGIDAGSAGDSRLLALAQDWSAFFTVHPHRMPPPILLVVQDLASPRADVMGRSLALARLDALKQHFPPRSVELLEISAGLSRDEALRDLAQALLRELPRAERVALLRELRALSERSTLSRLASQLGATGRLLVSNLRARTTRSGPGE